MTTATPAVVPIIVLQTSLPAYEACLKELARTEFQIGSEYIVLRWSELAEVAVIAGERQMLVTGTFGGDQDAADQFVREMKERNLRLFVAMFSSLNLNPTAGIGPAPYNIIIKRGRGGNYCDLLIDQMSRFLAGE